MQKSFFCLNAIACKEQSVNKVFILDCYYQCKSILLSPFTELGGLEQLFNLVLNLDGELNVQDVFRYSLPRCLQVV
jgi:hypothetical protein